MPKETTKKNNKGKKTTKVVTSKKAETKKAPNKKVEATVTEKKIEVKETVKPVVKEKKKKERKRCNIKPLVEKITSNTPFAISLCIILLLIGTLLFVVSVRKIPKTSEGKEIIATIKGKKITADELYESLKETYGTDSLMNLIDTYIAEKEVEITKENKEYVEEVVDYYKEYAEYYGVDLSEFLASYVGLSGIETEDEFYDYVLEDYKKTLTVTNYIGENASEEDLKAYYKENYSDKLTVKHILIEVDSEAEDTEAAEKEAKEKAKKLIKELKNTSSKKLDSKFEELAEDNSDDTATYSEGGLIEDFGKTDVVEEFWDAAYALKDGEYTSEPVKTTYGYHIILKVSSTPVEKYKDIKEEVKTAYAESLLNSDSTLLAKKWDEIRNQYKLSIEDDFIKKIYKDTLKDATSKKAETEKTEKAEKTEKTEE